MYKPYFFKFLNFLSEVMYKHIVQQMQQKVLPLLFILVLIVSCQQKETKKIESNNIDPITESTSDSKEEIEKNEENLIPEQYFQKDTLLSRLTSDLEKIALDEKFSLKLQPHVNTHDTSVIDTLKILSFDKTKIYSYQTKDWELIYSAEILNSEFQFLNSIQVGTQREKFEEETEIETNANLIKIGNLEQTFVFIFEFSHHKIKTIAYQGYVD
tara:strand:- start:204 stop:842 length:639 start_codon:yes stop_codon:yes gene_type:complete